MGTREESLARTLESIGEKQATIYRCLMMHRGLTRQQIAKETGFRLSTVCGRVNEMLAPPLNLLEVTGRQYDPDTNRNVEVISIVSKDKQMRLI